jgi:hypothetical protein
MGGCAKRNPKIFSLTRSAWSNRCLLTHSFDPSVVTTVETFMSRNIARALPPGRIAQEIEPPQDKEFRHVIAFGHNLMRLGWRRLTFSQPFSAMSIARS